MHSLADSLSKSPTQCVPGIATFAAMGILFGLGLPTQEARAQQTLSGDYVEINYSAGGQWADSSASEGLKVRTSTTGSSAVFQDVTWPGAPWQHTTLEYRLGTTNYRYEANYTVASTTWTVNSESDLSTSTQKIAEYDLTAGYLDVLRTDTWDKTGTVVQIVFEVTNTHSSTAAGKFRLMHGMDVDIDYSSYSTYNTLNDTVDTDGDGVDDFVQSEGPSSGWTVGYGMCDTTTQDGGHNNTWSTDADAKYSDDNGASADDTMHIRQKISTIAAGDTETFTFIFVFGKSPSNAQSLYTSNKSTLCSCDADGDGYDDTACGGTDCDDTDASIHPGADEYCNGVDDDCDGTIDEDDAVDTSTYYADDDGDGYGDATSTTDACDAPSGYVTDDTDCDDTDGAVNPGATEVCNGIDDDCDGYIDSDDSSLDLRTATTYYADSDGDGWGDAGSTARECDPPSGYVTNDKDCDDTDADIYPGADEYCNGVDDDCDGTIDESDAVDASTWYADSDGDGYGAAGRSTTACEEPSGYVSDDTDCDDSDPDINPGAIEICNGVDDDCDGDIDTDDSSLDTTTAGTYYADDDGDGYGDADDSTTTCEPPSGYVTDDTDCDDTDRSINPGAEEY